jgi:hypothetical protein
LSLDRHQRWNGNSDDNEGSSLDAVQKAKQPATTTTSTDAKATATTTTASSMSSSTPLLQRALIEGQEFDYYWKEDGGDVEKRRLFVRYVPHDDYKTDQTKLVTNHTMTL